jgi:hypothetical protein
MAGADLKCVYCLTVLSAVDKTDDHVIARSWYPTSTMPVAKWKAPACKKCNNKFSAAEGALLRRLALTLPKSGGYRDIVDSQLRSLNPKDAKSDRDAACRLRNRLALSKCVVHVDQPMHKAVIPSSRINYALGSRTGVLIPKEQLDIVVEKWIRGIHFCEMGWPAPLQSKIDIFMVSDAAASGAFEMLKSNVVILRRGPGVEVRRSHVEEGELFGSIYEFDLWHRFRVCGAIEGTRP